MYVYFESTKSVLTCEELPQLISVENMLLQGLENMCNRWEKNNNEDGTFTLSFPYKTLICQCYCDNSMYQELDDYNDYKCYNCGIPNTNKYEEGDKLYLQNSGILDIIEANSYNECCKLCQVNGYSMIYKWDNKTHNQIYALHVNNGRLSDKDISNNISLMYENCKIEFKECVNNI